MTLGFIPGVVPFDKYVHILYFSMQYSLLNIANTLHVGLDNFLISSFHFLWICTQKWDFWMTLSFYLVFNFLRWLHTVFHHFLTPEILFFLEFHAMIVLCFSSHATVPAFSVFITRSLSQDLKFWHLYIHLLSSCLWLVIFLPRDLSTNYLLNHFQICFSRLLSSRLIS